MSSQNEQPEPGTDPLSQFDAFRARQADDRAQQEAQPGYAFPPEYAADPTALFPPIAEPTALFPPITEPTALFPPITEPVAPTGPAGYDRPRERIRSVLIFAGAVVLAIGVGFAAYSALSGSDSTQNPSTGGGTTANAPVVVPSVAPSSADVTEHGRTVDVRVLIDSIGADSFSGYLVENGDPITVRLTDSTRFGTEKHPFDRDRLAVGETVTVRGRHISADIVTADTVTRASSHSGEDDNS